VPEEYMESELIVPKGGDSEESYDDDKDSDVDIEIVDDTPPADRRAPRDESVRATPEDDDDELKNYSEGVQKRIKRLKYEFHEERREKEKVTRQAQEAFNYASALQKQVEVYRQQTDSSNRALIYTSAIQKGSELKDAKRMLKEAYEVGDTDKMATAQEQIAILANEKRALDSYTPPAPESVNYQQQQENIQPVAYQPAQPQVSAKAVLWKDKNKWFGKDMALTGHAIDIHNKLVDAGVDAESEQYYNAIDSAVYKFHQTISGNRGNAQEPAQNKQKNGVVVSSSRTPNGQTRTKVQLTESALAVAKRLGITPQQYAKELLKQQKENQ